MSASEDEEDDAYDLAQPTVTTSRSAASTIILNRLDDLEFSNESGWSGFGTEPADGELMEEY